MRPIALKTQTKTDRVMAFQIWYPAEPGNQKRAVYQPENATKAMAEFLGLPLFAVSFIALVENLCRVVKEPPNCKGISYWLSSTSI